MTDMPTLLAEIRRIVDGPPAPRTNPKDVVADGHGLRVPMMMMDSVQLAIRDAYPREHGAECFMVGGKLRTLDSISAEAKAEHTRMLEEQAGDGGLARKIAGATLEEAEALAAASRAEMISAWSR